MKTHLRDDWKQAYKWLSVNCMALAAAIQGAWVYIPDDMRQSLPQHTVSIITMVLMGLGIFGRITTKQDRQANGDNTRQ